MPDRACQPLEFIEGPKIQYEAGGRHPSTRDGRCFVRFDKGVFARVLRPMRVAPGPGVPPQILDAREASGTCDTHKQEKQKVPGSHRDFKGTMKGDARLIVTMANGPNVRR